MVNYSQNNVASRLEDAFSECVDEIVKRYDGNTVRGKLRLSRKLLGMTQVEFAEAFGISPITVRNWESESRNEPKGVSAAMIELIFADPPKALQLANLRISCKMEETNETSSKSSKYEKT